MLMPSMKWEMVRKPWQPFEAVFLYFWLAILHTTWSLHDYQVSTVLGDSRIFLLFYFISLSKHRVTHLDLGNADILSNV